MPSCMVEYRLVLVHSRRRKPGEGNDLTRADSASTSAILYLVFDPKRGPLRSYG